MKYQLKDTWVNDDTITSLPVGAVALSDVEWNNRQQLTPEQIKANKATELARLSAEAAQAAAKTSAYKKLAALGLTADEIAAL